MSWFDQFKQGNDNATPFQHVFEAVENGIQWCIDQTQIHCLALREDLESGDCPHVTLLHPISDKLRKGKSAAELGQLFWKVNIDPSLTNIILRQSNFATSASESPHFVLWVDVDPNCTYIILRRSSFWEDVKTCGTKSKLSFACCTICGCPNVDDRWRKTCEFCLWAKLAGAVMLISELYHFNTVAEYRVQQSAFATRQKGLLNEGLRHDDFKWGLLNEVLQDLDSLDFPGDMTFLWFVFTQYSNI